MTGLSSLEVDGPVSTISAMSHETESLDAFLDNDGLDDDEFFQLLERDVPSQHGFDVPEKDRDPNLSPIQNDFPIAPPKPESPEVDFFAEWPDEGKDLFVVSAPQKHQPEPEELFPVKARRYDDTFDSFPVSTKSSSSLPPAVEPGPSPSSHTRKFETREFESDGRPDGSADSFGASDGAPEADGTWDGTAGNGPGDSESSLEAEKFIDDLRISVSKGSNGNVSTDALYAPTVSSSQEGLDFATESANLDRLVTPEQRIRKTQLDDDIVDDSSSPKPRRSRRRRSKSRESPRLNESFDGSLAYSAASEAEEPVTFADLIEEAKMIGSALAPAPSTPPRRSDSFRSSSSRFRKSPNSRRKSSSQSRSKYEEDAPDRVSTDESSAGSYSADSDTEDGSDAESQKSEKEPPPPTVGYITNLPITDSPTRDHFPGSVELTWEGQATKSRSFRRGFGKKKRIQLTRAPDDVSVLSVRSQSSRASRRSLGGLFRRKNNDLDDSMSVTSANSMKSNRSGRSFLSIRSVGGGLIRKVRWRRKKNKNKGVAEMEETKKHEQEQTTKAEKKRGWFSFGRRNRDNDTLSASSSQESWSSLDNPFSMALEFVTDTTFFCRCVASGAKEELERGCAVDDDMVVN